MKTTSKNTKRLVVIGAGVGGLFGALKPAFCGINVSIFEKASHVGGKIYSVTKNGKNIDMGPTVLTMKHIFENAFAETGLDFCETVPLIQSDLIARHIWEDKACLDLFQDKEKSTEAIRVFAGTREAEAFVTFCKYAKTIYDNAQRTFLSSFSPRLKDMATVSGIFGLACFFRIDPFRSMHKALKSIFKDPRLIQLFSRYATYYGASPYSAPATLNLIAHAESEGVWLPVNGMSSLAAGTAAAIRRFGGEISTGTGVKEIVIEKQKVKGVILDDERFIPADIILYNGDVEAIASGAMGEQVVNNFKKFASNSRSLSALITVFVGQAEGIALSSHNVIFPEKDYSLEFSDIFQQNRLPSYPAVYIRAQDRDLAVNDCNEERFFLIINAPPLTDGNQLTNSEITQCMETAETMLRKTGINLVKKSEEALMTPTDFAKRFPHSKGAIYGAVAHSPWAPLRRCGVRSPIQGLYLAGGSVHPGAGVPTAALSGCMAAKAILQDLNIKG